MKCSDNYDGGNAIGNGEVDSSILSGSTIFQPQPSPMNAIALPNCGNRWRGSIQMTGPELKQLREDLAEAIGKPLSAADMAKLCGLSASDGADTIRRWEVSDPSGPAAELLRILAMASERHPILENFNVFNRHDVREQDRPARRQEFRQKMRDEVRRRLG